MMRSTRFITAVCAIIIVAGCVWCFEHERRLKDQEASMDAAIRLLVRFHTKYLNEHNIPLHDYEDQFDLFFNSHSGFSELKNYLEYLKTTR